MAAAQKGGGRDRDARGKSITNATTKVSSQGQAMAFTIPQSLLLRADMKASSNSLRLSAAAI